MEKRTDQRSRRTAWEDNAFFDIAGWQLLQLQCTRNHLSKKWRVPVWFWHV